MRIPNNRPLPPPGPIPRRDAKQPKLSSQKLKTMAEDASYLALRDSQLVHGLPCANAGCHAKANQIHHVLGGNRRRETLTNVFTWLPVCSTECHDALDAQPISLQVLTSMYYQGKVFAHLGIDI